MNEMTRKAAAPSTTSEAGDQRQLSVGTVALDLLDTAWRLTVPVVVFVLVGIWADNKLSSAPVFTGSGTLLGFVIGFKLLLKQLSAVENEGRYK